MAIGSVVEGQARGVQSRSETSGGEGPSTIILSFRLERFDESGNRELLVPVEMRGRTFEGSISDGDWVRVQGRQRRGTLRAKRAVNLTTGAEINAKGIPKIVQVIGGVFVVAIFAFIAWIVITGVTSGGP